MDWASIKCNINLLSSPNLVLKLHFDSTLARQNNFGNTATTPAGNSAQSQRFNSMSAHYVELVQDSLTELGSGEIVFLVPETNTGGVNPVDFDQAVIKQNG